MHSGLIGAVFGETSMKALLSAMNVLLRRLLPVSWLLLCGLLRAETTILPEGDFVLRDFRFRSGESLPEVRMHYRTFGSPRKDPQGVVRNAVLILHGTTGSGAQFLRPEFSGELFGAGQPLDTNRFFLVLPDNLGHGQSAKPSDGLQGRFPRYGYHDMIEAQRRLLVEGLGVDHLRLVFGTSMGGMHAWMWGQLHPDFMDGLMPMASLPGQISGRNRVWRRVVIDAIQNSPDWHGGHYTNQPAGLTTALQMLHFMGSNPLLRQQEMGSRVRSDEVLDAYVANARKTADANDILYAVAASEDYDPAPGLDRIQAPLLAINFADDLINPPELGILEREIVRVKRGRALLVPAGPATRGHGTHTVASVWRDELIRFLQSTETPASR